MVDGKSEDSVTLYECFLPVRSDNGKGVIPIVPIEVRFGIIFGEFNDASKQSARKQSSHILYQVSYPDYMAIISDPTRM